MRLLVAIIGAVIGYLFRTAPLMTDAGGGTCANP
jgi:hypothetical protein